MRRPNFVHLASTCLLLDVFLVVGLPFLGYLSILGILLMVPVMLAGGALDAMKWLRSRQADSCPWAALSAGMCGSGFLYLLLALVVTLWIDHRGGDLWAVILYVYLLLVTVRLHGAAFFNCLLAPVAFAAGRGRVAKAGSASALLNSALGIYLMRQLAHKSDLLAALSGGEQVIGYLWLTFLLVTSFLGGLVWGATLQWLAWRTRGGG